jgi:hypothetical protein
MQATATPSSVAETTSSGATPITSTRARVSAGPASAPQVPATAMTGNRRLACSLLQMSAMKLQNTDTTNRLNTLTQTKNSVPSARGLSRPCAVNSGTKQSRQAMKNPYTSGTTTRLGQRATSQANTGVSASVARNVAA